MWQWFPERGREEPLDHVYADLPPPDGHWVAIGMVASVDGRAAVDGTSGGLGGEGDLAAFRALRAAADVVLVGAGTARAEGYGPPKVRSQARARRQQRGQAPRPALGVVTRSCDLDGADRLFEAPESFRPLVVTCAAAPSDRRDALQRRGATVLEAGQDRVDPAAALDALAERGLGRVLVEGGPRLNTDLLAAGLVDELFVTVAARLVGGPGPRLVADSLPVPVPLALREGRQHGDEVLLRYTVGRDDRR